MQINQFMSAIKYQVSGGSAFGWNVFKERNLRYIDFNDANEEPLGAAIIADDGEVLEVLIEGKTVEGEDICVLWREASFNEAYEEEALERGLNPNEAWEGLEYTHIIYESSIINALNALIDGKLPFKVEDISEEEKENSEVYLKRLAKLLNVEPEEVMNAVQYLEDNPEDVFPVDLDMHIVIGIERIAKETNQDPNELLHVALENYIRDYDKTSMLNV